MTTMINADKFTTNVTRLAGSTEDLSQNQKNGILQAVTGGLTKLTSEPAADIDKVELEDRVTLINFALPIFDQLKPEVKERVEEFLASAAPVLDDPIEGDTPDATGDGLATVTEADKQLTTGDVVVAAADKKEPKAKKVKDPNAEPKKKGKPVDESSGRQQILRVLRESPTPLSPKQITDALMSEGREVKYVSSHLNYFKVHNQVLHTDDKRYTDTQAKVDLAKLQAEAAAKVAADAKAASDAVKEAAAAAAAAVIAAAANPAPVVETTPTPEPVAATADPVETEVETPDADPTVVEEPVTTTA